MKLTFSCVAWEGVSKKFSKMILSIDKKFNSIFADKFYGAEISEFQVVLIAVDSNQGDGQNEKFSKKANKCGSFKDIMTGKKIKFISFGLEYFHEYLEGKSEDDLKNIFLNGLRDRLDSPDIKIVKDFDYSKFSSDMKEALGSILDGR